MRTLVEFIARIDIVLYVLAGVTIFFSIRNLTLARQARRIAVFGLEREDAQRRQRRALNTILFMLAVSVTAYVTANIVSPNLSGDVVEPTATPLVFVTTEPSPTPALLLFPTITPTPGLAPSDAEAAAAAAADSGETIDGCTIFGTTITDPTPGQNVSGQVAVSGEANILNFGQYKFEIRGAGTGEGWTVVGTFTSSVTTGFLGTWDSTSLPPGNYQLRLVVSASDGSFPTPCEIPIVVLGAGASP